MTGGNKKLHVAGASDVKKNKPKVSYHLQI
jgi:hypothetical protein